MPPAISIRDIHKHFGSLHALRGVNLEIRKGEFFALLGPNGAGKTTLISILAGLTRADSGVAEVLGHDVVKQYGQSRSILGVVPQELVFDPFFTVRESLKIQSGYFGLSKNDDWIDEVMHHLDLTEKRNTNMRALSGGMKRRVLVAQALVHKPPVIILDEPTAGVDVELRQTLWRFIQKLNREGHTIVLTTHYLEEAEMLCNRVAMLKQGQIVALDSTQNLLATISDKYVKLKLSPESLPLSLQPMQTVYENGSFTLAIHEYTELENVLAQLREANVRVCEMELVKPDLEDVFVQIMGKS